MLSRLSIHEADSGQALEFELGSQKISEWLLSRDRDALSELCVATPSPPDVDGLADHLGQLVPFPIQRALAELPRNSPLLLSTESRWPWELALVEGLRLQDRFSCRRDGPPSPAGQPRNQPGQAFIIRDRDTPDPEIGVSWGEKMVTHLLTGPTATAPTVEAALFGGECALAHLSIRQADPEHLYIGSNPIAVGKISDSSRVTYAPGLIFLVVTDAPKSSLMEPSLSLAEGLRKRGVACVVALAWAGVPRLVSLGVRRFYAALASGDSVAQSMRAFREAATGWTAGSLFACGDTDLRLEQIRAVEISPPLARTTVSGFERPTFLVRVLEGPDEGREIPLFGRALASGRPVTIGRSGLRRCDIELDDPSLDNLTLRLEIRPGAEDLLHLVNLTGEPEKVRVNGLPVVSGVDLETGDSVSVGQSRLLLEAPKANSSKSAPPAAPSTSLGRYQLEVLTGVEQDHGRTLNLEGPIVLLGRLDECGIRLHDPGVSRRHASIVARNQDFFISPVGEARLIVNGVPVTQETPLAHDDRIELSSKTLLRFADKTRSK